LFSRVISIYDTLTDAKLARGISGSNQSKAFWLRQNDLAKAPLGVSLFSKLWVGVKRNSFATKQRLTQHPIQNTIAPAPAPQWCAELRFIPARPHFGGPSAQDRSFGKWVLQTDVR